MIEEVFSIELPVGERLIINKNRITGKDPKKKRLVIVTGIHGDEFEGQYICYEMVRRLTKKQEKLTGTVDVYPALNPLGLDVASHKVPKLEMDLNRMFPGNKNGTAMERVAAAIVEDISGADMCLDMHASNSFVREIPQVRLNEIFAEKMLPFAKLLNADMVWTNATATVHESTLAHSMNMLGVPSMVVEMGVGNRIDRVYGNQVVEGIFHLMEEMGMWEGEVGEIQYPVISTDGEVDFIRSKITGVFLPAIAHNHYVRKGDKLGEIVSPLEGKVLDEIRVERSGLVFTLREYPFVREGALLARILMGIEEE
ncbi:N-alpha-acetyl-L-2,4-diaminobutyric acid deacetylase [Lachnospiraceae bacterium]|jgi:predicted deacylase|nr:succinylglutamate desuccinylase [Lachnospiraceae bacterium]GFI16116.1 N-alpha-acetyl-L-2,4-diaminobutyric acid deacetylase [Lachnospiraceae bacterium]GFI68426.1 N-alpha-acetyl-L-2,4-diaminobutyric acid deacetylase [Lachnospiraceae bacterium]